jgi:hypothetical protein
MLFRRTETEITKNQGGYMNILRILIIMLFTCLWVSNLNAGAINPETGEYYPGTGNGGAINPETGEYYPGTGNGGAINPETGEYYPGTGNSDDGSWWEEVSGRVD